jgi:adenylate cyclase
MLDDVTDTIVATLASGYGGRLRKASRKRDADQRSFEVFDYFTRGLDFAERFNKDDNARSRIYFEKAVQLDPSYGKALAKLAWSHMLEVMYGWGDDVEKSWRLGLEFANAAIERDDDESWGHWALAAYCRYHGQHDRSLREFQRAIDLNPNDADVLAGYSFCLSQEGQPAAALKTIRKAMRLNPHYPDWYTEGLALAYYEGGMFQDAIDTLANMRNTDNVIADLFLAACHISVNNTREAAKTIQRVLQLDPTATISKWAQSEHFPYSKPELLERLQQRLRSAGLPE